MHKQSSNSSKYIFPKLSSDNKRITTPKNNFKKFNFDINNNNNNKFLQKNSFCQKHREPFIKYCQNCDSDLCEYCVFTHDKNHSLINYTDIIPDENEINLLKQTLKIFRENYTNLLHEIKNWEKNLHEKISFVEKEIENDDILNNINFINDFTNNEINFKNIFKFRKIFDTVFGGGGEFPKNNNIMEIIDINNEITREKFNMNFYNYTQYNLSKALLDLLINNNINIENSFIYKGNLIIKYIWDSYININNINKINPNKKIIKANKPKKYDTSTYCGSLRYDKDDDIFLNNNNKAKIIEKHIDLKKGSKKNIRKLNPNLYSNNTYDINNNVNNNVNNNSNNIFNRTMSTSFSSKNLLLNNSNGIYFKKKCNINSSNMNNKLNQTSYDISKQLNIDNYEENTKLNDSGINSDLINKKMNALRRTYSFSNTNKNYFNTQKPINKTLINNSDDNQKDIITSKYIPQIRVRNLIYNKNTPNININNINNSNKYSTEYFPSSIKNKNPNNIIQNKDKTFIHKKFEPNNNLNNTFNIQNEKDEDNKLNQTQLYNKLNDTSIQEDSLNNSNILNTTYSQSHSNNYFSLKNNIIISQKKSESNSNIHFISNNNPQNIINSTIKSTIFKPQLNNNLNNSINNNNISSNKIQIRKCNYDTKYIINPNIPLCLSIELDNDFCKICFINQLNQEIDIFSFSQDNYSIPIIISFNEKNEVIIGNEADQLSTTNPKKTFFNIMKLIGKNYDDILGNKEIWPFKIYKDEKNRPLFWINFGKSEKKFYPEDLLSLYLKKLFNIFFQKISCDENNNNNIIDINLILVICLPNNFTYIQRKIISKIFEKQIFPNNNELNMINTNNIFCNNHPYEIKLYNNYHIILKKIKIENISSIAALCLKPIEPKNKNNKSKSVHTLILNIGGTQTNISVVYYPSYKSKEIQKKKFFGIKSITGIELGSQDFTDAFVSDCLKEFDQNLFKQCLESPNALAKMRRSCNTAEKIFGEDSHVEIKVNKLYDTYDLKMILNKSDYEKVCDDLYKKIINEIKKTIKEAKLSEINIDHVLLMGNISRSDKIKNLLKNLFKHNRLVFNKLSEKNNNSEINNDFFTVIGGAIQAKNYLYEINNNFININNIENISSLNDITPMSFGVETINGMMEFVVEKGTNLPVEKNKYIKIRNDGEKCLEIKIYEGEDDKVCNNKLISSANIDKRNFKFEKAGNNYIEILLQFVISSDLNLCVYVLDIKTMKKRFECLINIDLIKS